MLGAGMVGSAMAIYLAKDRKVKVTDISIHQLKQLKEKCHALDILELNATDKARLQSVLKPFNLVISELP